MDIQLAQVCGSEVSVIIAHGGGGQDHQVALAQASCTMGLAGVIVKTEALFGLAVDVGHPTAAVHGEHGVGGCIHHVLQDVHKSPPVL